MHRIFITGASGYMGSRVIPMLLQRGHEVRAVVRKGSEKKLSAAVEVVVANVLDGKSYAGAMSGCDTLVHLVGVAHPSPAKAEQFRTIDLKSVEEVIPVAKQAGIKHVVYLSVAHPAPVLKSYWEVRAECEELLRNNFPHTTFLRPWYVLGPGHRWAVFTAPLYWLAKLFPSTRQTAERLSLVTISQMMRSLVDAIEHVPEQTRIIEPKEIQRIRLASQSS